MISSEICLATFSYKIPPKNIAVCSYTILKRKACQLNGSE